MDKTNNTQAVDAGARGDALYDSAYCAGLQRGFSFGQMDDNDALLKALDARQGYLAVLREQRAALSASTEAVERTTGQWVHCSPSLIKAGVSCAGTPRRECACTPENGGHDHWIAHSSSAIGQKLTDEQIDAIWANTDSRGYSMFEPYQWEVEMRRRFARALLLRASSATASDTEGQS